MKHNRRHHHLFAVLPALLLIGLAASCSVKEDRTPCPCYLNVYLDENQIVPEDATISILGWNGSEVFRANAYVPDFSPYWVRGIHKGRFHFSAFRGIDKAKEEGHCVIIPFGEQSDSLYASHTEVDATGEIAYAVISFRKQFCTVHLDIQHLASEMPQFRFLVEGNTCGFDLLDFMAIPGPFRCEPVPRGGARVIDFRIPRQKDDSMTVSLLMASENGSLEKTGAFPLGKYIVKAGYDWNAEELQDIYISIDLVLGQILIQVEGWELGQTLLYYEQ